MNQTAKRTSRPCRRPSSGTSSARDGSFMASTGAPVSSACERIGARLFASRPNHRRESYVVRGVPRNSVAPTAVLPPSVAPPSRTSDLSARALQVVSIVCRSIGNYLRRAAEVGESGARALRRGVTCLLPRSRCDGTGWSETESSEGVHVARLPRGARRRQRRADRLQHGRVAIPDVSRPSRSPRADAASRHPQRGVAAPHRGDLSQRDERKGPALLAELLGRGDPVQDPGARSDAHAAYVRDPPVDVRDRLRRRRRGSDAATAARDRRRRGRVLADEERGGDRRGRRRRRRARRASTAPRASEA